MATLTVRVIRNFEYRVSKNLIFHNVDLATTTVGQLKEMCQERIQKEPGMKLYRNLPLDTLKIYVKAQHNKTMNLIINLDHDEWILSDDKDTLAFCDIEHETELSYFNLEAYKKFQANPEQKWM
ncbi:eukaryotic protein [Schizosaccharomyces japonicus yFS275]|uniref:Eukaryotic protein n=1 Tax=Schizosaccharomyces japonicus (strain yFS275 / FY16936) TaxID=402676 RepID=B6K7M5_SCHJY|nr:eukaryotic protein [Schizosaccharomyces japonicus yFS275]EEB09529.1 eukaryotic protein [Schizosaccharomyces japonicus yFS275]